MDESTRRKVLTGGLKLTIESLTEAERILVLEQLLEACKPSLPYLGEFKPLRQHEIERQEPTNQHQHLRRVASGARPVDIPGTVFAKPGHDTRALFICVIRDSPWEPLPPEFEIQELYITVKGDWIVWTTVYHATPISEDRWEIIGWRSKVTKVSNLELATGLEDPRLISKIIFHLDLAISKTISDREKWLTSLRESKTRIAQLEERIE